MFQSGFENVDVFKLVVTVKHNISNRNDDAYRKVLSYQNVSRDHEGCRTKVCVLQRNSKA